MNDDTKLHKFHLYAHSINDVVNSILSISTSGVIYQNWRKLGWQLCVDEPQIIQWDDELHDGTNDLNQILVRVIAEWVRVNSNGATLEKLICHLRIINWNDSADRLKTKYKIDELRLEKLRSEMEKNGGDLNFLVNAILTTATSVNFLRLWRDLARKLDIPLGQISQIEAMCKRRPCEKEILRNVISKWKLNKKGGATDEELIDCLKQLDWNDSAANLETLRVGRTTKSERGNDVTDHNVNSEPSPNVRSRFKAPKPNHEPVKATVSQNPQNSTGVDFHTKNASETLEGNPKKEKEPENSLKIWGVEITGIQAIKIVVGAFVGCFVIACYRFPDDVKNMFRKRLPN